MKTKRYIREKKKNDDSDDLILVRRYPRQSRQENPFELTYWEIDVIKRKHRFLIAEIFRRMKIA